ncbi:MAG: protein kinase [Planctomycetes bacterium]|nr:protein kinase [Planctomycetota bacterium]
MAPDREDEESIFHTALALPAPERSGYLRTACGSDPVLLTQVESLLAAHNVRDDFLEAPILEPNTLLDGPSLTEGPGTVIGRYQLLEKIGEGGMAVVYLAEQTEPIRRKVALKIIKLGMDTRQVIARFEAERQALAWMDHPGIAKVFDGGATETGRPYFVMELVQGVSITEYCDRNFLSIKDRLALFLQVCQAVQHAHQKGLIHRDLKPSNVMVTHHDGKPVPKVIDFGIAKATDQKLTEKTLFTRYAHIIGTPAYMSPEQAELSDLDVDTRSDIYSLGVLLYELLTGTTPFSEEELRRAGYLEMQRMIREQEPVKPSTRIRTATRDRRPVGASPPRACSRACSGPSGREGGHGGPPLREVRGDLDWIVMKALEKDRARRYESASALLDDLQRHLACEPVSARPPSLGYRSRKLLQRHGKLVALLVTVVLTLVLATVVSTSLYVRLRRTVQAASTLQDQVDLDRKIAAAHRLYFQGQHVAALKELEATLAEQDPGPQAHLFHAQLLIELQRSPEAEAELLPLAGGAPEIAATAHYLLARACAGQDPATAAEHEALATSLLPDTAQAYTLRAMTAANQDEALTWLERAIALDPSHYPARKARALIYYCQAEDEKGVEDVAVLIALRPKSYLGYALRAAQRREAGRLEAALADHNRALDLCEDTSQCVHVLEQRYTTQLRRGDCAAALQDARRLAELCPQEIGHRLATILCLLALEDYADAKQEYRRLVRTSPSWDQFVRTWLSGYVFHALRAGLTIRIPPERADQAPFAAIRKGIDGYNFLVRNAVQVPGMPKQGTLVFCWSPDSKRLLCSCCGPFGAMGRTVRDVVPGLFGRRFLLKAIDVESGKGQCVPVSQSGFPAWSPDGKHIAFRDKDNNICLISPEGGPTRIVARGARAQWSQDSQHLYFQTMPETGMLYCVDLRDPDPEPVEVMPSVGCFLPCEPQGWMALGWPTGIRLVDLASQSVLHRCPSPWPVGHWQLHRSPNGKELSFASWWSRILTGTYILDTETKELYEMLDHPACQILWSPDGSKIAIAANSEIWVLRADPNYPISRRLGRKVPGGDLFAHELAKLNRAIAADPSYPENYLERAVAYCTAGRYAEAEADLRQFEALVTKDDHHIGHELFSWLKDCYGNNLEDAAARLEPYAERFMERFPAEMPSCRPIMVAMIAQHERRGRTELATRWKARLQAVEPQGDETAGSED